MGATSEQVLILCTANQCRSPMAQGLLRHILDERGVDAIVSSAGLRRGGAPATADAVDVLAGRGIDIAGHRSRSLADVVLTDADLIITMERRHLQEAILLEPSVRHRAFTLPELARRAQGHPPRTGALREWATAIGADRPTADLLGTGDGVADPIGSPRARYVATAELLADLLEAVAERAWPSARMAPR